MTSKALLLILFGAASVIAQQVAPGASYEAASIRRNSSGETRIRFETPPGRLNVVNAPLRFVIRQAYRVPEARIIGGPEWLDKDRFDIQATAPGATTGDDIRERLRTLIKERFGLSMHMETREMPVYVLKTQHTDGRFGANMHPSTTDCTGRPQAMNGTHVACGILVSQGGGSAALLFGAAHGQSVRVAPVPRKAVPESQTSPPRPGFDVASIKPARRGEISPSNPMYLRPGNAPGSLEARNAFLTFLISNAYGVKEAHIYNGPSWVHSDGFDIIARTDLTPEEAQRIGTSLDERNADLNLRLQSLLEKRFGLKVHRETRQLPVFILTVAKGGLKVQPSDCVTRGPYRRPEPGQPSPRFCGTYSLLRSGVGWKLTGNGITMKDLVRALSYQEIPTLIEQTGYAEPFNGTLEWTPDSAASPPVPLPADAAPSLSTALQEQLGIKLESTKGPVEALVIDHVERPTEN